MIADFIAGFIRDVIGSFIGGEVAQRFINRKRAKATERGIFLGAIRVQSGSQRGLGREWTVGEWRIRPGHISMVGIDVHVRETVTGSKRPALWSEVVGGQDTTIVTVQTDTAVLEWSMLRRFDGLALRALSVPGSTTAL